MDNDVTVVITSCKRHLLLQKTLESFLKFNTYKGIEKIIIYEDSEIYPEFLSNFPCEFPIEVLTQKKRVGQIKAIDYAYAQVNTKYIFHCEDDWEFYASHFIEASKTILENNSDIYIVHLREGLLNILRNVVPEGNSEFSYCLDFTGWFTLNPGLRRLSDYKKVGSYGEILKSPLYKKNRTYSFEEFIGMFYHTEFNYITVFSLLNERKGAVRHIGAEEHIRYHHRSFDRPLKKLERWLATKTKLFTSK